MLLFLLFFLFSFEDTNFSHSYFVLVITILYNLILSESVFVAAAAIRRNLRNISGDDQKVASHSGVYIRSIYTIQTVTVPPPPPDMGIFLLPQKHEKKLH